MNTRLNERRKEISKETKTRVNVTAYMIDLLHELGFRDNKTWKDEELPMLYKIEQKAKACAEKILKDLDDD